MTIQEITDFCLTFPVSCEDYPFADIVLQREKRLEVLKLRLRLPFRSPAGAGSLHSQRHLRAVRLWRCIGSAKGQRLLGGVLRAPRGSTFFKLNGYI